MEIIFLSFVLISLILIFNKFILVTKDRFSRYLYILFIFVLFYSSSYSQNKPMIDYSKKELESDSIEVQQREYGIGISYGFPSGFNTNFDIISNNYVFGFVAGFFDDYLLGLETNIRYRIKVVGSIYFEPQFVLGIQHYDIHDVNLMYYFGVGLGINIYGVNINYGRVKHSKNTPSYIFTNPRYVKLGYTYYF